MVTKHTKLCTIKIVPPDLQGKHNSCQLQVMNGVVSLMHLELPRRICHRFLFLHQNTTKPKMRCVTVDLKWFPNIRNYQYGGTSQPLFKLLKVLLTFICLSEGLIFSSELCQRRHYLGESFYEPPIVAS